MRKLLTIIAILLLASVVFAQRGGLAGAGTQWSVDSDGKPIESWLDLGLGTTGSLVQLGDRVVRTPTAIGQIVLQCMDQDGTVENMECGYDITVLDQDGTGMLRWRGSLNEKGTPGVVNAMRGLMNALRAQAVTQLVQP